MKIGYQLANFAHPGGPVGWLADLARQVEDCGFDSLWVVDHLFQIEVIGPAEMDMLEAYSVLSYLAAVTSRVRLGAMVTSVTFRHPALLVKVVTSLDVLSGGRACLGLGAGWFEREHRGLGIPFPSTAERFERLEETLQIALQMWSGERGPYRGKHFHLEESLCVPQPLSRPHPPILLGGMGERKTLRLAAQYGQGCNFYQAAGAEVIRAKLKVLRGHCEVLGTDYEAIEKTTLGVYFRGQQARFGEELDRLAELGVDTAVVGLLDPHDRVAFDELSTLIPQDHYSGP